MTGQQQVAGRHSGSTPCTPKMTLTASRRRSASPCAAAAAAAPLAWVLKSTLRCRPASAVSAVPLLTLTLTLALGACDTENASCTTEDAAL